MKKTDTGVIKKREIICQAFRTCGGCSLLTEPYEKQLQMKQKQMEKLLSGFGPVHPITGMEEPYHYRNKVHAVFGRDRNGRIISGTYREGTHQIVPVDSCAIEDRKADAIIRTVRDLVRSFRFKVYDEDSGTGLFRHVLIRSAHATGQIMVVLVLASPVLPSSRNFVRALLAGHPEITTIVLNVNNRRTSMILGERESILFGKGYIEDVLCGCTFRISSKSFYQVNSVQTEVLYRKAVELAALTGKEHVIDAYCGIGTIGLIASAYAEDVTGVENNADAVRDAIVNARRNRRTNIRFVRDDATEYMLRLAAASKGQSPVDVIFMDPPRTGSTQAFIRAAASLSPVRIVYVSCGPETLARDLKEFARYGYEMAGAWPVDMFPQTGHVESCVLLERVSNRKTDAKVRIDVDLEDYYRIKAGQKNRIEE